jgi:hypothetical protein
MNSASSAKGAPPLRGKTIVVYLRDHSPEYPVVLSDCMLEQRAGRVFLVGASQPVQTGAADWTNGIRRAVAWDAVDQYLLFDSASEYHSRIQNAGPQGAPIEPGMPIIEFPKDQSGHPLEPSGIHLDPETALAIGDTVLSYSQGRWWRAEVVDMDGDETVTIHFPGWDSKWDATLPKTELQVDLRDSLEPD